jgi:D-serine dehydratase
MRGGKIQMDERKVEVLKEDLPLLRKIRALREVFWINSKYSKFNDVANTFGVDVDDVSDAENRLKRFASYIEKAFPETKNSKGIIESPLVQIPNMKSRMEMDLEGKIYGNMLLKCDNALPIAGSIKARGGIYEVLKHAETLAIENKMLSQEDDYSIIDSDKFREFFSQYTVQVGSTGNLGLSIGIMSAKLGFKVKVHMSADAKQWKKDLLRSKGVDVVEYSSDYSKAVEEGRKLLYR